MGRQLSMFRFVCGFLAAGVLSAASVSAQEINTSTLSENGWFSDDTRADGSGTEAAGTNLISDTLTDDPEGSASGTSAHDADINAQIIFGDAVGAEPALTHGGAVHLGIVAGEVLGKSAISHRKDDGTGHGPGSGFGPGFTAEYSWMGDGTPAITTSLKFGIKTAEFGAAGVSSRTGENVWDKLLIFEPGNLNGGTSDALWHTETIDYTTGKWWFFDRVAIASIIGTPMTLSDMAVSPVLVGGGPKTVADVYALITAPGAHITSVQFGIGSYNAGGSVYANQLETSVYRAGMTTTFGQPSPYDQDVTPDAIFGSGNDNGSFTVDRQSGVELGLRAKLRFPPTNAFMSNGDGTYTYNTGSGTSSPPNPEWHYEWAVNSDYDDSSGLFIDDLVYELGIDFDPGPGTDYLVFDPIAIGSVIPYTPPSPPVPYWDHSIGDNSTPNGGGVEAGDAPTYAALIGSNNVAQNSWRTTFHDEFPFVFDPDVPGRYEFYLTASSGGSEVARTEISVIVTDGASLTLEAGECQTDQDAVLPGVQAAFELWLRNPDDVEVTGFQAFLEFDDVAMSYEGTGSSYTSSPFGAHIQDIALAEVFSGQLRLDGNTFSPIGHSGDALLATLLFTVTECDPVLVDFDLTQPFDSELSFFGASIVTALVDSPTIIADDTAPVLTPCPADITQPADAGSCTEAVVTWADPTATDNCDLSPVVVCSPPSGSTFSVGTTMVTCTATDECGNESSCSFDVTVTATNAVDVIVELTGSDATSRCIHFVTDICGTTADATLTFVGSAPAIAVATIEVPCGVWTQLCAKDEQHTKWAESPLIVVGANYVATATIVLDGGDTDNDGDVDINDVTLFLAQFGGLAASGGCPWDGVTRDADFSNNGAVASEDYPFLTDNWLSMSSCSCSIPLSGGGGGDRSSLRQSVRVYDATTMAADLNRDGRVDVLDVELIEQRRGLSGALSERMRASQR